MKREKEKERKEKGKKKREKETNLVMLTGLLHYCTLLSREFLLFSTVPLFVKPVAPIRTTIAIHLMVSLAIHAFEDMRTWLTNIGSCMIHFLVFHTTSHFLSVVFGIISSIALSTSGDVRVTTKCQMSPLSTVFTLRNPWVHVCSANSHNELSNIKSLIDDVLCARTALGIPDVHPYYCFIQLG